MREINIPVSEFLARSLEASISCDYAAFLVFIARTADGESLQDEILHHWESLDDLTYDQISVITPKSQKDDYIANNSAIVRHPGKAEGYINKGLKFGSSSTRKWESSFWDTQSSHQTPFDADLSDTHTPRRPISSQEKKAAITATATDTAKYFGIPEIWLPCIVFLSLRESEILVFSVDKEFSLYSFIRNVLIGYEPTIQNIKRLIGRISILDEKCKTDERIIGETRMSLRHEDAKNIHMIDDWRKQINSVCDLLRELGDRSQIHRPFALNIVRWLHDDGDVPQNLDQACADFLDSIRAAVEKGDIPEYLANRIITRLPRIVSKKKAGYLSDVFFDSDKIRQLENQIDKEVERLHEEIRLAKIEKEKCLEQISETKNRNSFSQVVMQVAEHENFSMDQEHLSLPERLKAWSVFHFRKRSTSSIKDTRGEILSGIELFNQAITPGQIIKTILFLAADPADASRLRLGEEFRAIQENLKRAKLRDGFRLELPQLSIRPSDISQALLDMQPQIVHFSGHGTAAGALRFENHIGETHLIQPDALAALFEQFANQINCVVLNTCYSEIQANVVAQHIDYVVGMNHAIGDKAAIAFAVGFYQALGAGRTIEEAYKLGCVQIRLHSIPEHLTPVLIKKAQAQP